MRRSGVGTAVIHHDDLISRLSGQGGSDFIKQWNQAFRFIQNRDDNGKIHTISLQQVGCKPSFQATRYDSGCDLYLSHDAC